MKDTLFTHHEAEAVIAILALGCLSLVVESVVVLTAHMQHDFHDHDGDQGNTGHYHVRVAEEGAEIDFPGPRRVQEVVEGSVRGWKKHK